MERQTETFDVDTIKHYNSQWETELFQDGVDVVGQSVYVDGIDLNGPVSVEFDEYFTFIRGDMKVTVSWVEWDYRGDPYTEDYRIDSVEVFE